MRREHGLLGLTATLGIGLFAAMFFILPKPSEVHLPPFLHAALPQAQDRVVPIAATPDEPDAATLIFVGDVMLARSVEEAIVENGTNWPFAHLDDLFADSDLVVGNFEGTVRDNRNIEVTNQMIFDTTPDNVAMLERSGFTTLSLANNHADDYGEQTTRYSRQTIIDNGMTPFGDPFRGEQFIDRENINGISLSLIGFHAFGEKPDAIVDAIKAEHAQGRFVIVYPHWGVEYAQTAPTAETYPADLFVRAGADLIIGAHPHVIQNVEVVDGVPVVYSLGNFLFDQDFSSQTKQGLTVRVRVTNDTIDLDFTPVKIENRQTTPMSDDEAQEIFTKLNLPGGHLSVPRK